MNVELRSRWSTRQMSVGPSRPDNYLGAAVHWPGEPDLHLTGKDHSECLAALRNIENYQMGSKGYGAIAYQVIACLHGHVIEGRGRDKRNGANGEPDGSYDPNILYGSILALIGEHDSVTDTLLTAIHGAAQYLRVSILKTHNDVRPEPTACPGPELTKWIKAGYPYPEENSMDWSDETINLVTGKKTNYGALIRNSHRASIEMFHLVKELAAKGGVDAATVEAAVRAVFGDAANPD